MTSRMTTRRAHRTTNRLLAAAGLGVALMAVTLLTGCYSEGGPGVSLDQHAYVSTTWQPKTVTLRDTRTGQALWSIDVPVGKKLVILFRENAAENGQSFGDATPDLMLWELMEADEDFGPLHNKMPVPPSTARKLDMTLRTSPELPAAMGGAVPTTAPAPEAKPAGGMGAEGGATK